MAAAPSEDEGAKEAADEAKEGGTAPAAADGGSVGLPHWERQRSDWVSGELAAAAAAASTASTSSKERGGENRQEQQQRQQQQQQRNQGGGGARAPVIDPDANYDDLLLTNEPFEVPIPLPEMVDFLVDTWIDDGLY